MITPRIHKFAQSLRDFRRSKQITQSEFSELLGLSQARISKWENGDSLPDLEDLFMIADIFGEQTLQILIGIDSRISSDFVTYLENTPDKLDRDEEEIVQVGLSFFRNVVINRMDFQELMRQSYFRDYSISYIYRSFKTVLRKGYLQIENVKRNVELEEKLLELNMQHAAFPNLKGLYVADIPDFEATIISTELVVTLARDMVLKNLKGFSSIGVGSGYTLSRLAENFAFNPTLVDGIEWIPLVSYPPFTNSFVDANYIAKLFANIYGGIALHSPFIKADSSEEDKKLKRLLEEKYNQLTLAFVTVNGVHHRSSNSFEERFRDLLSSDYSTSGNTYKIFRALQEAESDESGRFAGEVLGYLLDSQSRIIGTSALEDIQKLQSDAISLHSLSRIALMGNVWLIASRLYKAKATMMALRNGLVSSVVIDNTIANYLVNILMKN